MISPAFDPTVSILDLKPGQTDLVAQFEEKLKKEEEWRKKRLGKFTASEIYRLMTGVDETQEEAINKLANSKQYTKEDLQSLCIEHPHVVGWKNSKYKKDFAELLIESGVINYGVEDWPEGAETYVTEKVIEQLTGEPFQEDLKYIKRIQWGKDHEVEAIKRMMEEKKLKIERYGDDQEFICFGHPLFDQDHIPKAIQKEIGSTPDGWVNQRKEGAETKCPDKKTHFNYKMCMNKPELMKEVYPEAFWQVQNIMYVTGWKSMWFESYDPRYKNKIDQRLILKVKRDKDAIKKMEKRLVMAVNRKKQLKSEWIKNRS